MDNLWKGAVLGAAIGLTINVSYVFGGPVPQKLVHPLLTWISFGAGIGYLVDRMKERKNRALRP